MFGGSVLCAFVPAGGAASGAVGFGVGYGLVNVLTQLVLVSFGDTRADTYGGLAARMLFSL